MKSGASLVLLIEDNPGDTRLIREMLKEAGGMEFELEQADHLQSGLERIDLLNPAIILLDLSLPDSLGLDTFEKVHKKAFRIPIVVLTSLNDTNMALQAVHNGAQDYLLKNEITSTVLSRAIRYAIERHKLHNELREAIEHIKTLKGLLPICAKCKNIRNDKGYWEQLETYLTKHSDVSFTHGYCPQCAKTLIDDVDRHVSPP